MLLLRHPAGRAAERKERPVIRSRSTRKQAAKRASPESPARRTDARVQELDDWRGKTLARVRALIEQVDPDVVEESKWNKPSSATGVPVWSHDGIICTGETYKDKVKLTFVRGAALEDASRLFNSSLEGNARRAIDIREGDKIDEEAFKALVRAAVVLNTSRAGRPIRATAGPTRPTAPAMRDTRGRRSDRAGRPARTAGAAIR
jgi:hypothetical protein